MHYPSGMGNWNISYTATKEGVWIHRALTCDVQAVLPEEIDGQPVVALGEYALAAKERKLDASFEVLEIRNPRSLPQKDADWSNRSIRSLRLPRSLQKIGHYAFFGLRNLETLELPDNAMQWGQEPFMNCLHLHRIILELWGKEQETLAILCRDLLGELDVTIREHSQEDETLREEYRLLFPGYAEVAEENTPARQLDLSLEGIGYPYHHVMRNRRLSLVDYDTLWKRTTGRGAALESIMLRIAWFRIAYPYQLEPRFRQEYLKYLGEHPWSILKLVLTEGSTAELQRLLHAVNLEESVLQEGCELAREQKNTQGLAILLESLGIQPELPKGRRKRFEL